MTAEPQRQLTRLIPPGEHRINREQSFNGIKFFAGSGIPPKESLRLALAGITPDRLREEKKVWRPDETLDAARIFFGTGKVKIIGAPQEGKGTILFGLSEMCDLMGVGYVFIDGHHQDVSGEIVTAAITEAERRNIPVFFDSADYLFLRSRGTGRSITTEEQSKRLPIILAALDETVVPTAITMHSEDWAEEFLNLKLRQQYAHLIAKFVDYVIPPLISSDKSIRRFLLDHEIPEPIIYFLLDIKNNKALIKALTLVIGQQSLDEALSSIHTYPVLKELVRDRRDDLLKIMEAATTEHENLALSTEGYLQLVHLVLQADKKRKSLTQLRRAKKRKK
ncbi:hypothetical protein HY214_03445 [Candidatus Roizmanbacteria bacterium]|nr:hypothetical protein [Candidatus Roizmanbacteria bacterium]